MLVDTFSLLNRFTMHKPLNATHNKRAWSSCLTELALPFLGMNVMYSSTKTRVCSVYGSYLWLSLKGNLGLFQACLMCWHVSSAPHSAGSAQTWQEPNTFANCLLKYSDKSKWNFRHVSVFMDTDSSVFEDMLLHRIHIFVCFACQAIGILIVHLQQRLCCFWTWRTIQKLYPSHCLLSESYFQHSKSSCSIFPQFKAKFDTDTLLYQVPIS